MLDTAMRALTSVRSPWGERDIIEWLCSSALREALTHCCALGPNLGLGHKNLSRMAQKRELGPHAPLDPNPTTMNQRH
jgi:hypothetical protein